ncbi:nectin-2 isoform X2 [Apteryx mantelli]|uniref:Nectin-2 isoform X2 n=1 Tax=Apteryx mantelli TaxID=2696672 RepID=A0ABM4G713_9AVES
MPGSPESLVVGSPGCLGPRTPGSLETLVVESLGVPDAWVSGVPGHWVPGRLGPLATCVLGVPGAPGCWVLDAWALDPWSLGSQSPWWLGLLDTWAPRVLGHCVPGHLGPWSPWWLGAWAPRTPGPRLLLTLTPGGLVPTGAGGQRAQVQVREEVVALVGEEAVLPCVLAAAGPHLKVSQVTWVRAGGSGGRRNIAVLHPRLAPSFPGEDEDGEGGGRLRFRGHSLQDATLLLQPLRLTDQGVYTCEFATYPDGNQGASTRLLVLAKPQNHAAAQEVAAGSIPTPVATCTAAGGHPAANISWESPVPGTAEASAETAANGTVTVTSRFSAVPTRAAHGQRLACVVSHPSLPQPQRLPVTLAVLYPPVAFISGYDHNWYLQRRGAALQCNATANPAPTTFTWSTSTGPLPPSAEAQGNQLLVHTVDLLANTTFICRVSNALGSAAARQPVLVLAQPRPDGAGATGGIIGAIVASVVAAAVVATAAIICRQQRKNRTARGEDGLDEPPPYKPPPPGEKLQELPWPLGAEPLAEATGTPASGRVPPRYHELPTAEEPHGDENENEDEDGDEDEDGGYVEQLNPLYDRLRKDGDGDADAPACGFVMSPAVYV